MIKILSRYTGAVLYSADVSDVREAVIKAGAEGFNLRSANLSGANLGGADLGGANLSGANLGGAYLRGAYLGGANLSGANLRSANLRGAYLRSANLSGANLSGANLSGANLSGANLSGAYLRGAQLEDNTVLQTGESWRQYLTETLPALMTAGGKTVKDVAKSWECHQWDNCPMHAAFNASGVSECPILLRPRVDQFVQLFDAELIPCPKVADEKASVAAE